MRLHKGISLGDMDDGRVSDNHTHGREAVNTLAQFLNLERSQCPAATNDAIDRLEELAYCEEEPWTPDIIHKAFDDLDEAFFNGALLGHVHLIWCNERTMRDRSPFVKLTGTTTPLTVPVREADGEITGKHVIKIYMNADRIFLDDPECANVDGVRVRLSRWALMWRTLIHEMIHCYLHVATGFDFPDHLSGDADPGHGFYFQTLNRFISTLMHPIFGFGLPEYTDPCILPNTAELRRKEDSWLKDYRKVKRMRFEMCAKTPEEYARISKATTPNIRVWK